MKLYRTPRPFPIPLDWELIAAAVEHYMTGGFQYIDVPWLVSREAIRSTLPAGSAPFEVTRPFDAPDKCLDLIGSAEQGFVEWMRWSRPQPRGQFVSCTPCFRAEPVVNELYQLYFMKVELISITDGPPEATRTLDMLREAISFFQAHISNNDKLCLVPTDIGHDIYLNDIEIGSYGTRSWMDPVQHDMFHWVYGTGLALPRFSVARK